ncbi:uncharacterized protein LOC126235311 [Schistocerca nitens]|uniref:uncharacterized protein LOC126235311 n=1 Tax=Schistocerca nitens TaxID=7011 RepID=UPI00211913D5|nr:uncharacterized protein LOC126235311 [Schistocerca nitens]
MTEEIQKGDGRKGSHLRADGRTLRGRCTQSGGGVGRNLADALARTGPPPLLVSAVGDDQFGRFLLAETLSHVDTSAVDVRRDGRTACYTAVLDKHGECHMGIGDMNIHDLITPSLILKSEQKLRESCMILMDGNIPQETVDLILKLAEDGDIPVWFEPTDVSKSIKPFRSSLWKSLYAFSPNLNELKMMAREAGFPVNMSLSIQKSSPEEVLEEVTRLGNYLVNESISATAVVTLGNIGLAIIRRGTPDEPFYAQGKWLKQTGDISARLYPAKKVTNLVNVMGAGDCLAAGFIRGMLLGLSEERCAAVGLACASAALNYDCAVPVRLLSENAIRQTTAAEFLSLY